MENKEPTRLEIFQIGAIAGMYAALDSLSVLQDERTSATVDPHTAMTLAVIGLGDWLESIKGSITDELPEFYVATDDDNGTGYPSSAEFIDNITPPGVTRFRGITYRPKINAHKFFDQDDDDLGSPQDE